MGLPDSMATSPPRPRSPRTASLAHTATETDIGEVRSMMATNADLHAAVQCKPKGTSCRRLDQLHAKADETQVRVSKVHAQEAQQVALLSRPSGRFHDRVFIARSETGACQQNHREDLRRANEQLTALDSQVQTNEPELEDAQLAHEQVEDSAMQLKPEHSSSADATRREGRRGAPRKGPREQTARPGRCAQGPRWAAPGLRCGLKKTAMATASVSSLPHPDSRTSTAYPDHAVK